MDLVTEDDIDVVLEGFRRHTLDYEQWTHQAHLTVATVLAIDHGGQAIDEIRAGIQSLNMHFGVEQTPDGGYHETLTVAWTKLIAAHLAQLPMDMPRAGKVHAILEALTDKRVILDYYSRDRIMSVEARFKFVEPDLTDLP